MGLENPMMKETYIKLLRDTLERKLQVVNLLLSLTEQQEKVIAAESFDEELFSQIMGQKSECIDKLNQLDQGFDQIYQKVEEELQSKKDDYKEDIINLQELITKITDKSISVQALEKRNRNKLELILSSKRKDIKNSRSLNKSASSYYKTMVNQQEQKSYFYDKKN